MRRFMQLKDLVSLGNNVVTINEKAKANYRSAECELYGPSTTLTSTQHAVPFAQ